MPARPDSGASLICATVVAVCRNSRRSSGLRSGTNTRLPGRGVLAIGVSSVMTLSARGKYNLRHVPLVTSAALPHLKASNGMIGYFTSVSASLTSPWPGRVRSSGCASGALAACTVRASSTPPPRCPTGRALVLQNALPPPGPDRRPTADSFQRSASSGNGGGQALKNPCKNRGK